MKKTFAILSLFLSTFMFTNPSFAIFGWDEKDLQREIIMLHALMGKINSVSGVGAWWARNRTLEEIENRHPFNNNDLDRAASASAELASGWQAIRISMQQSAALVSHEVRCLFFGTDGKDIASTVAHQFDNGHFGDKVTLATKEALYSGASVQEVGVVAAQEAAALVFGAEKEMRAAMYDKLSRIYLASNVDYIKVITMLKNPLSTDEFKQAIPEIQIYYVMQVNNIERKMRELKLI